MFRRYLAVVAFALLASPIAADQVSDVVIYES